MAELVRLHRKDAPRSRLEEEDRIEGDPLAEALARSIDGEVRFDAGARALYAQDAANYRHPPIGVVVPRHDEDVVRTLAICRRFGAPVLSRGGGTSLAGQCCNRAVVLDFSKYMREVIEVDGERRLARVQPGAVLDRLNDRAADHGLVFAPDPATHTHCTLGGMIGNNSCGVRSIQSEFYGPGPRTEHHVRELDVLTYDGLRMRVTATSDAELERVVREGGRRAEIYGALRRLRDRYADEIRARFPDIPRRVSGYNLPALLPENGFHVAQALVGTESTCVTILEATLELGPRFPHRALLLLGYEDIAAAGDDVPRVRALEPKPIGVEGIDDRLVAFVRKKGLHPEYLRRFPEGDGWLLVELGGRTAQEARDAGRAAQAALARGGGPSSVLLTDPLEMAHVWKIRESGLGATAFVPGEPDSWPGWEDSAVHPDRVGPYLRELRALFDRYAYRPALYGHLGHGCVHCRVPFDFSTDEGVEKYRRFTQDAAELVVRFGGSLSGEHGDGQTRGELLPIMYGERLVEAFREFKAIWDPANKMNPGRVVDALPRDADLRFGPDYPRWEPETRVALTADGGKLSHAALRCVGVGECRREGGGVMCPSYMVTLEEKHSTRGRAHLLFEMLRGEELERWKSEEVADALDLCLACKGCKSDCPVNVDMALYKAEFLYHYYQHERRPRHAYAFGLIDRWARVGALAPGLANWITHAPLLGGLAKRAVGMAPERDVPRFAQQTFRAWFRERGARVRSDRRVILWPDTFNDHFFPGTLVAALDVLESAGVEVDIPHKPLCCGRPLYDYGMLDRAERYWRAILSALRSEILAGTVVVGVEPSCVAAFRDELLEMIPNDPLARALSRQTKTLGEYLESIEGWAPPKRDGARALYHAHCHHQSVMGVGSERRIMERMGLAVDAPKTGCCGMAGAFGFEREHYDVSVACGERALLPRVRELDDDAIVVAEGFSCREQIVQSTGRMPAHLAEVMQAALHEARPAARLHAAPGPASIRRSTLVLGGAVLVGAAALLWVASRRRRGEDGHGERHWSHALGDRGGLHPERQSWARARDDEPRDRVPAERDAR